MTSLAHQTLVEHQILEHIKDALRLTLEMKVSPASLGRKFSSVRFMTQSFQRHLDRLLDFEEDGGYMELVEQRQPRLFDEAIRLRTEHAEFRQLLTHIMLGFEQTGVGEPEDIEEARLHGICHKLHDLLDRLDEHEAKEIGLLEQVLIDPAPISSAALNGALTDRPIQSAPNNAVDPTA